MNMKIVSIVVCMLMFATVLPAVVIANENKNEREIQSLIDSQDVSTTGSDIDWWPMFRHDPQHTGHSTSSAPNTNNVLWSHSTGYDLVGMSSPVIADDRLYIGTLGPYYMGDSDFLDLSLDVFHGNMKSIYDYWKHFFLDFMVLDVIRGNTAPLQLPGRVYCLNAETGSEKWVKTIDGVIVSSPAIYDGKVYVPSIDVDYDLGVVMGKFFCLDAQDGDEIWSVTIGEWEAVPGSSPAIVDGKIYIPTIEIIPDFEYINESYFIGKFLCLDAEDGDEIWSHTIGEWEAVPGSSPAVDDGKIYIPTIELSINWTYPEESVIIGKFLCLDAEDGDEIWSHTIGEWEAVPGSSPAVDDGKIYIPTIEADIYSGLIVGRFLCLDAEDGDEIWSHTFGEYEAVPGSSPAVADGKIYIPTIETDYYLEVIVGRFLCLDAEDGDEIWTYTFSEWEGVPGSSPAIADGKIYIPTIIADMEYYYINGTIYAFGDPAELEIGEITGGMGKVCAEINSTGEIAADNVEWNITVKGGVLGRISVFSTGTIDKLGVGNGETVCTDDLILGLGRVNITVTADADNADKVEKTASAFVFLFLVLRIK